MKVVKRSGEREEFDRRKTIAAVMRAGVTPEEAEGIVQRLETQLYEGITTEEIYRRVHEMLQGRKAARYSLKKALLRLGPEDAGLESLATKHRLFPITILDLRRNDQSVLLAHRFVVVDDLLERVRDLRTLLPKESARDIEAQARELLQG
jgi:hypothetical protein